MVKAPLDIKDKGSIKTLLSQAPQEHLLMFSPAKARSVQTESTRLQLAASYCQVRRCPAKMDTSLKRGKSST